MKQVTNLIFFYKYYQIASENIQLDSSLISLLCVPFGMICLHFLKPVIGGRFLIVSPCFSPEKKNIRRVERELSLNSPVNKNTLSGNRWRFLVPIPSSRDGIRNDRLF